uniref:Uncharacterized protein n=1 Tax=viral metagenome TaxID=1070528 RepID=A0A6C0HUV2_9ZZZZ
MIHLLFYKSLKYLYILLFINIYKKHNKTKI